LVRLDAEFEFKVGDSLKVTPGLKYAS